MPGKPNPAGRSLSVDPAIRVKLGIDRGAVLLALTAGREIIMPASPGGLRKHVIRGSLIPRRRSGRDLYDECGLPYARCAPL
jgi:hypothetical protein